MVRIYRSLGIFTAILFLFKSTHHSWRYGRKCEWVFFSEHSVKGKKGKAWILDIALLTGG